MATSEIETLRARLDELEAERARFVALLGDANTWWSTHNELATTAKDPGDARYQEGKAHGILHCLTAIEAALSGKGKATAASEPDADLWDLHARIAEEGDGEHRANLVELLLTKLDEIRADRRKVAATPTGHAVAGLLARVKRAWDGAKNESEAHPNRERAVYCDGTAHGLKEAHRMIGETLGAPLPLDEAVAMVLAMPVEAGEPIDFANDIHCEVDTMSKVGGETRESFTRIAALAIHGAAACGAKGGA